MSSTVEKNDVDVSKLFAWGKEFEVVYGDDRKATVFIRLLGDADMGKARVGSLRRSAELRRKLKDPNSDERVAFIPDRDELERDRLISLITVFSMRELTKEILPKLKTKLPKQPKSDARTELLERYQAEVDAYPAKRQEEIRELLNQSVDKLKKSLEKETDDRLYTKYVQTMIDELCEQELLNAFKEWCSYLGSYKDDSYQERFFSSFEEFSNIPSYLKDQFSEAYTSLEIYGEELKKLRQVTP